MRTYPLDLYRTCPKCGDHIEYTSRAAFVLATRKNTGCPHCRMIGRISTRRPTATKYEGIQFRHVDGSTVTPASIQSFADELGLSKISVYKRMIYDFQTVKGWSVVASSLPKAKKKSQSRVTPMEN